MVNSVEKDNGFIAIFDNPTEEEQEIICQIRLLMSKSNPKPKRKFQLNFGNAVNKNADANDYDADAVVPISQTKNLSQRPNHATVREKKNDK